MKNFVQKEVDKQLNNIQDHKDENYHKIVAEYFQEPQRKHSPFGRFAWKIVAPVMVSCILILGTVSVVNFLNAPIEHVYFADNELSADATLEEIDNASKSFDLSLDAFEIKENKKIYDSVSDDTLRFRLMLEENTAKISAIYVVNANHVFDYDKSFMTKTTNFQGVDVKYSSAYRSYTLTVYAYLEKDGQELIITYTERAMDDSETAFWSFMDEFVTVK